MPRKRQTDHHLPPRVYRTKSGAYQYHPRSGGSIRLGGAKSSVGDIEREYKRLTERENPSSLFFLIYIYKDTEAWERLSPVTQHDYEQSEKVLIKVFGNANMTAISQPHVRQFMDARGKQSRTRANRELAYLSNICAAAFERGLLLSNPCKAVKKFYEPPRNHYVEDAHYQAMLDISPIMIQVAMEIGYCTGLRQTDVLNMAWSQVRDGLEIKLSKTGVDMIKELSPRLQAALNAARKLPGLASMYVLHNQQGQRYTRTGFNSTWRRYNQKLPESMRFQYRDIRKKAITDWEGETKIFSGHKTDQMAARYKLNPIKSPSH
ncbi:MAG: hypothetical protein JKY88_09010 [Pseudomonadales bacterium]|nr:hypothetical protein [Pseudomonadales bacterium]